MSGGSACLKERILQCGRLPVLPSGVSHLLQALMDENIDNNGLKTVIGRFPSVAARLLFLANSAWAAPPVPVTSLDMACARLGLNTVRSVSIALAIASPFNLARCPAFDAERYWCSALLVADGAAWLASSAGVDLDVRTVHTAGLLHNLGLLWLADNRPQETAEALMLAAEGAVPLHQALQRRAGMDYCEVGGCLGDAWELPGSLVVAMREQCNPDYNGANWQYAALVRCAAMMVSAVCSGEELDSGRPHPAGLNLDPVDRDAVLIKIAARLEGMREMARALFPG